MELNKLKVNLSKGNISYDSLLSLLPLVLTVVFTLTAISRIHSMTDISIAQQEKFDRLVSISEYVVKEAIVKKDLDIMPFSSLSHPNWIESEEKLNELNIVDLETRSGINNLQIGFVARENATCIYRLVVVGESKDIKQLFVCGD
ncbi:MAG: hypothetical protein Q7S22_00675 [Candidatus Micrarchaeota archaeon]|nr:hypothetical protein [Candidatus Micrarchaeota archaeon]